MNRKKGEKNIVTTIIKIVISLIILGIQFLVFYLMLVGSLEFSRSFSFATRVLQAIVVIYMLYGHEKLAYKIPWLILIMFLPIAGIIIYFLWGKNRVSNKMKKARDKTIKNSHYLLEDDSNILEKIKKSDIKKEINLLKTLTGYPVYENCGTEYLDIGEEYFKRLLEDIKNAQKYILIEFFIIAKGKLYNRIYDALKEKLKSGVKVIIIADGWGSLLRYPKRLMDELEDMGAIVKKYNPLRFGINTYINYRDHRKIVVIDGCIAYTGGVNIADEYTNEYVRFGHWKDTGIRFVGKACQSATVAFLKNLEIATNKVPDYEWFIKNRIKTYDAKSEGLVMFYTDGPDNRKNPGENTYIELLNNAKEYVYIYTPYFVASSEMLTAILNAKYSGVDVRIITPHKPDKWYVHLTTRSYYDVLLKAGVKVYEYLPGFLHAKSFVSDDDVSIVGSINLDYRSLNLSYECATWTNGTGVELKIKEDFLKTMNKSVEITLDDVKNRNIFIRILEALINTFAPLM